MSFKISRIFAIPLIFSYFLFDANNEFNKVNANVKNPPANKNDLDLYHGMGVSFLCNATRKGFDLDFPKTLNVASATFASVVSQKHGGKIIEKKKDEDEEEEEEEVISKKIAEQLLNQRSIEALTGKCNFGPHRDDIEFLINNISVRKYGSSGQQRTFILALKMAELDLLSKTLNVPPILILDDVLAELDITRQNLLLNSVGKDSQCFISATHLDKFNQSFLGSSQMIHL